MIKLLMILPILASANGNQNNVFGEPLSTCSTDPMTGYYRNGKCTTDANDRGTHIICARVTTEFLNYSIQKGNDLTTPSAGFKGLTAGDKWCICALRWLEAKQDNIDLKLDLNATHTNALKYTKLTDLEDHAYNAANKPNNDDSPKE